MLLGFTAALRAMDPEDIEIFYCTVEPIPSRDFIVFGWYWPVFWEAVNVTVQQEEVMFL